MNEVLGRAYMFIFGIRPPSSLPDWLMAEMILNKFDVPKLGEELAKQCIFQIVNHISYPDHATTRLVVGHAENLATELWDELPDEPHMAQIAYLERIFKPSPRQ
jgi:hypothetical protein